MWNGPRRHAAVLGGLLLAGCPSAFALDPSLDVSQYVHTSWRIRDGFAKGSILSIAQTPDGYLWLGTDFGLLRFDGVRTTPWKPPADQHLPSTAAISLLAARDGTLWIGTRNGLASWKDGRLTNYPVLAGQIITSLLQDRGGRIWVGTIAFTAGRLCVIHEGSITCQGQDGALGTGVFGLYEDGKGNLWAGGRTGLWRWRPGPPRFQPLAVGQNGLRALAEDEGALLVGIDGGLRRLVNGNTEAYPLPGIAPFEARGLVRDRDGSLWIAAGDRGLLHVHRGRTDLFSQMDGLSGSFVKAFLEDREGNMWVATVEGLDRFRTVAVHTYTQKQGLSGSPSGAVLAASDGSVWVGTSSGLNRWSHGHITTPGTGSAPRDGKLKGLTPHSLFEGGTGRIWASTAAGIGYLENDRFVSMAGVPGGNVRGIVEDAAQSLWIANQEHGLFQLLRAGGVQHVPPDSLGTRDLITALATDPSSGGLWTGFYRGGIAHLVDGQLRATYGAAAGLGTGLVADLRVDPDGTLWAATEGGLSRLKHGGIVTLSSKNGLPCDTVHWIAEDDAHSFWLYMPCGLVRVARAELEARADGRTAASTIPSRVFDSTDGVRLRDTGINYVPRVSRDRDGKLWFASQDGVSVVDPRHLSFNTLPPPVHIEQITADRRTYDAASLLGPGRLRLPPLVRDLAIDYTALSLAAPEKVRFRYKLEGWDREWQEAGTRRQAVYGNLPPRRYRFRVTACNNSGVWNEAGASLDFDVAPAYYQAAWFRVAAAATFLALLAALYRLRLRQATRQVRLRLEARLAERERIARDLHDTLIQSVQGLILKVDAAARKIGADDPARRAINAALDLADQILAEGRDRVEGLRGTGPALGDLPAAFERVAQAASKGDDVTFKSVVEGHERELDPTVLEECYSIGREALVNALNHAEARHVEVEIGYDPREFRLRVRDDGRGIDPAILGQGSRDGHWGLQGMRERARGIGASVEVWSRPGAGTEVELRVPAATAYRGLRSRAPTSWFRRPTGGRGRP